MTVQITNLLSRIVSKLIRAGNILYNSKIMAVRAICSDGDMRIYLVRHTYTPGWHLPGGGIGKGASARETLAAELWEEGRLKLIDEPVLRQVYLNKEASSREHIVLYTARVQQEEDVGLNLEIADGRFFRLDALPNDLDVPTARRIQEFVIGSYSSTAW